MKSSGVHSKMEGRVGHIEGPLKNEMVGCSLKNEKVGWLESRVRSKMRVRVRVMLRVRVRVRLRLRVKGSYRGSAEK